MAVPAGAGRVLKTPFIPSLDTAWPLHLRVRNSKGRHAEDAEIAEGLGSPRPPRELILTWTLLSARKARMKTGRFLEAYARDDGVFVSTLRTVTQES